MTHMEKMPFEINVEKPGYYTLKIYQVDTGIGIDRMVICTDEQAKSTQKRALIGCPQSYNRITSYNVCYTKLLRKHQSLNIAQSLILSRLKVGASDNFLR